MNRLRFWLSGALVRLGRWLQRVAYSRPVSPSARWLEKRRQRTFAKATAEWQARTDARYVEHPPAVIEADE